MKKLAIGIALLLFGLLVGSATAQITVTPYTSPRWSFVDGSGTPCALCKLSTYVAGTTTAQATYVDSTGVSQNTNPITLDVSGSAQIWLGTTTAYKFVLKDALGATVWTVDNVKGNGAGGLGTCTTNDAITYANTSTNTLACDSLITINPSSHAINVGGPITGAFFSLTNLATIPSSWTFDVTTPTTALLSLPLVPLTDIATQAADTTVMNASASTASPTAVAMPTGCTLGVNYSTTTHSWTCAATSIPLTSLAPQAADTVVMNATSATAAPTAVALPTGCTNGINFNTSTQTWNCLPASGIGFNVYNGSLGARNGGVVYYNGTGHMMYVSAALQTATAGGTGSVECMVGTTSPPSVIAYQTTASATPPTSEYGVSCMVPPTYYYELTSSGAISLQQAVWTETTF